MTKSKEYINKSEITAINTVKLQNDARGMCLGQISPYVYDLFYGIIGLLNRKGKRDNNIIQIKGSEAYEYGILPEYIYKKGPKAIAQTFNKISPLSVITMFSTSKDGNIKYSKKHLFSDENIEIDRKTNEVIYTLEINAKHSFLLSIIASRGFFRIVYDTEKSLPTTYQKEFYKLLCSERTKGILQINDQEFRLLLGIDILEDENNSGTEYEKKIIRKESYRSQRIVDRIINPTLQNENVKNEFKDLKCIQTGNTRRDWIFTFRKQNRAEMDENPEYRMLNLKLAEYLIPSAEIENTRKSIKKEIDDEATALGAYYEALDSTLYNTEIYSPIQKKCREIYHEYIKKYPGVPKTAIDLFVNQPIKSVEALEYLSYLAIYLNQSNSLLSELLPEPEVIRAYTKAAIQFDLADPAECIVLYNLIISTPTDDFEEVLNKITCYGHTGSLEEMQNELSQLRSAKLTGELHSTAKGNKEIEIDLSIFAEVLPGISYDADLAEKITDYVEYMKDLRGDILLVSLKAQFGRLLAYLPENANRSTYLINLMDDAMICGSTIVDMHPELFVNPTAPVTIQKKRSTQEYRKKSSIKPECRSKQGTADSASSNDDALKEKAAELLKYFNKICHTSYPDIEQFIHPIVNILKKRRSEDEIKKVIRQAGVEWGNKIMCSHLNPEEIFNDKKFEKFLGGADPGSFAQQETAYQEEINAYGNSEFDKELYLHVGERLKEIGEDKNR